MCETEGERERETEGEIERETATVRQQKAGEQETAKGSVCARDRWLLGVCSEGGRSNRKWYVEGNSFASSSSLSLR